MESNSPSLSYQERSVIDLLKSHVEEQKDAFNTLQRKAQYNFTTVNIMAAIVAGLNIDSIGTAPQNEVAQLRDHLYVLMSIFYLLVAVLSIYVLWVKELPSYPMKPTVDNAMAWSKCTRDHHICILRQSYLDVIQEYEKVVDCLASCVKCSQGLILFAVFLFLLRAHVFLGAIGREMP